jgi:hypothetical protein
MRPISNVPATPSGVENLAKYERRIIESAVYFTVVQVLGRGERTRAEFPVGPRRSRRVALWSARRHAAELGVRALVYAVNATGRCVHVADDFALAADGDEPPRRIVRTKRSAG